MTHLHSYFIGRIVGIAGLAVGLAGGALSNDKARVNTEKKIVYEARIVRDKTLRLEPFSADGRHHDKLGELNFQQGSQLLGAVIQALESKGLITRPIPDPIDPPGIILKDPFGILSGKKPLPWKLLNPAASSCTCKTQCAKNSDGSTQCILICYGKSGPGCE